MGLLTVTLGLNQHVSGLGITLLATALSLFGFRVVFGESSVLPSIDPFPQLAPLGRDGVISPIFTQYLLTYVAFLVIVPLGWWVLFRTNFGLALRSVGENPEAADAAGINVFRTRYAALMIGAALMAAGGAFLSLYYPGSWNEGISSGQGLMAVALVIFARWNPIACFWAAMLFGGTSALGPALQAVGVTGGYYLFNAAPYILTLGLMVATSSRNRAMAGAPGELSITR